MLFTVKSEDGSIQFTEEYIDYVKENFDENKNFSKMLMVFDNSNNILNIQEIVEPELNDNDDNESWTEPTKSKKGSKNDKKNLKIRVLLLQNL